VGSVSAINNNFVKRYLAGVQDHHSDHSFYRIDNGDKVKNASDVFAELDYLCSEREGWEETEHRNSTTRLYRLLASVYSVYEQSFVNGKDDDRRTVRQQLVGKLNAAGITVRKSADTLGLLVRYVFKADRRRVMSYKYAILAAKSHGVDPGELEDWLGEEGGLDEVGGHQVVLRLGHTA